MATLEYISENKTNTLKKGDIVLMHTCGESEIYKQKYWECKTDSYMDKSGQEAVFINGIVGSFLCKFLTIKNNGKEIHTKSIF